MHDFRAQDGQCIDSVPVNENKISFGCGEDGSVILNHESMSQHVCILPSLFLAYKLSKCAIADICK